MVPSTLAGRPTRDRARTESSAANATRRRRCDRSQSTCAPTRTVSASTAVWAARGAPIARGASSGARASRRCRRHHRNGAAEYRVSAMRQCACEWSRKVRARFGNMRTEGQAHECIGEDSARTQIGSALRFGTCRAENTRTRRAMTCPLAHCCTDRERVARQQGVSCQIMLRPEFPDRKNGARRSEKSVARARFVC
jgi:hypothetical protein